MQLGSCWVIRPIERAKADGVAPLERSLKGLWTGKGPQGGAVSPDTAE